MKKFLSGLFSLFVLAAIGVAVYFNQEVVKIQAYKVKGMYYVYKGDKAYHDMRMQKAIGYYNTALKYYPQHYSAWYNLGNIYVAYEDYYSALYAYSQAFKYNPNMMIARMNYGIVASEKLGDFDSAIKQYEQIIKTKRHLLEIPYIYNNKISSKENKAIAYYNMGYSYRMKSLYANDDWEWQRRYLAKAIKAYQKSLEINPKSYDTLFNLGLAYQISGNYEGAGKCYCQAISNAPMNYEAHYNLAVLLRKLRHYNEAYEEIEKASTLISALGENSSTQQYAAIVMNDIMRNVYFNEEYKSYLRTIMDEEKSKNKQHMAKNKKDIATKETKDDKENGTVTTTQVNIVNGKVVATEELDKAILDNFGKCPSMHYFEPQEEDY